MRHVPFSAWLQIQMLRGTKGERGGTQMDIGQVERVIEIERIDETAPVSDPQVTPAAPEGARPHERP
jgi:hypothetical protein